MTDARFLRESLCVLGDLCVSVVCLWGGKTHHRDTENTKVAQRKLSLDTLKEVSCVESGSDRTYG